MKDLQSDILIELHVPDFEAAKEYYGSIGYEVAWEKKPMNRDGYMVMRSGQSILNFYCGNEQVYKQSFFKQFSSKTPRGYGVEIIVPITDIETFYDKYVSLHPDSIVGKLEMRHSHQDFRATDPFGFYLRFVERYNWVDARDADGNKLSY